MIYTVYRITNRINSKTYIGVHKTDNPNDDYLGSGIAIRNAIKKYGRCNFSKEILHITESKEKAYDFEKILTEDFHLNSNYNMKRGGVGSFTKEAAKRGHSSRSRKGGKKIAELGIGIFDKKALRENGRKGGLANKGKSKPPMSEDTKRKISIALKKHFQK